MWKVLVYSRHNTTRWWRYVVSQLKFVSDSLILSEVDDDGDIHIMRRFYRYFRSADVGDVALTALGSEACDEIIFRCRVLTVYDRPKALRMIGAMWLALTDIVNEFEPDFVLTYCMDHYVLDLLERILRRRGGQFCGIGGAALDNHFICTARGEHVALREPDEDEVERVRQVLAVPGYIPAYVPRTSSYGALRFATQYAYWNSRALAFSAIAKVRRDPLNFYYEASKRGAGGRVRFRNWQVQRYIDRDWETTLQATPFDRRIFVALPYVPETTTDYCIRNIDFLHYDEIVLKLWRVLRPHGYVLFMKDHPNMFAKRAASFYDKVAGLDGVVSVPYDVKANRLIADCSATFTWAGTVGLEAALAGRCSIVVEAYYYVNRHFIELKELEDMDRLPVQIETFRPQEPRDVAQRDLIRHVLRACVPGDPVGFYRGFDPENSVHVEHTRPLVDSLNRYLPAHLDGRTAKSL